MRKECHLCQVCIYLYNGFRKGVDAAPFPVCVRFVVLGYTSDAFLVIKVLIASPSYRDTSTTLSRPVN